MSEPFLDASWHRIDGLRPRLRAHLQVHRHRYRGTAWYVVEDGASGRAHRLTPAVYQFVGLMDGERSVGEIWAIVVELLGDDAPTQGEVVRLLGQLNAADLLQTDIAPDAIEMAERFRRFAGARRRGSFGNPLALKFSLWNPDRFLDATLPLIRPFLSVPGAVLWFAVVASAVVTAAMRWEELTDSFADRLFAVEGIVLTLMVFPLLKILHELGHGYATKSAGGAVEDMGVMVLVLAPVPYVDASASIAFKSKWRRAGVGAAGMAVEVFVASLATFVWAAGEPGLVRSIAYHVMLIAGVSTVVFNANPLLRFDGYYILCDLLETPNLAARSGRYWTSLIDRTLFGAADGQARPDRTERIWFLFYAPLAFLYRIFVLVGISLFIASAFFAVGVALALWGMLTGLGVPLWRAVRHVAFGSRLERHRFRAVSVTLALLAAVVGAVGFVPVPLHTISEGVVWLPEESYVRAADAGFVKAVLARPGARVAAGDLLVQEEEPELSTQVDVLLAEIAGLRGRFAADQFTNRVRADVTSREIAVSETNLRRALQRLATLSVRSDRDGIFLAPAAADLPGRYANRGDLLGYVLFEEARIARVVVSQDDLDLVRNQLAGVMVRLVDRPSQTFPGKVVREVPAGSYRLPSTALAEVGGGRFVGDVREQKEVKTLQRTFQLDLELPLEAASTNFGSRVVVRFEHGSEPLAMQVYRRLRQTFLSHFAS